MGKKSVASYKTDDVMESDKKFRHNIKIMRMVNIK